MPQKDDYGGQMDEALEILRMIFVAHHESAEVEQPREKPFDFVASHVASQWPSVLGGFSSIDFIGRNHFGAVFLHQLLVELVTVVRFVPNQAFRHVRHHPGFQGGRHQFHFSWRSAFCPQGERKTMAVCNTHDLGDLAPLGFPNQSPPFLVGTNVPSTKHSVRSNPPASLRCCASVSSNLSITPERTQFWKRRCAVWYAPYRAGRSCQGAPVRNTHKVPLRTVRRSLQGRPRRSARTRSGGRTVS